jgi:2-amino-4-hydroxy-6-hydroxymethyldihydropteridine diphosphokinase
MALNLFITYIGLGSNLGDPEVSIQAAINALDSLPSTEVTKKSSLYRSAPIDADGDDYVNAVVELRTQLAPAVLLLKLQSIEQRFGRVRSYQNAPRTLDCDLLLYEQQIINTLNLQVPHPRMHRRAFVLIPLLEIAPEIHIPAIGAAKSLLPSVNHQAIQKLSKLI